MAIVGMIALFLLCIQLVFAQSLGRISDRICRFKFQEYLPSNYELLWLSNVKIWGASEKNYCKAILLQRKQIDRWLKEVNKLPLVVYENHSHPIMSRFRYVKKCPGMQPVTVFSYIEPLAAGLRDPTYPCLTDKRLEARSHYVMASSGDPVGVVANVTGRVFILDLGASVWDEGFGGSSQQFLYESYKSRGLEPSRMLLWEMTKHDPGTLFDKVPKEAMHAYQYFNIAAKPDPKDPSNPLQILRKISKFNDFVAIKLDIDNGFVEDAFIHQLMHDLYSVKLADEVFFEHHVNFEPMLPSWKKTIHENLTLWDSYQLFSKFRHMGIRFHGWP